MTRIGVVVFPGSNCEYDALSGVASLGAQAELIWHSTTDLAGFDGIILPGGFAHGDYLRPGALARFSPVMDAVRRFAEDGGSVLGICNGFQVLTEAGLLPGALQKNRGLAFLCQPTRLVVTSARSVLTSHATLGDELVIPINHFSGSYICDDATYEELVAQDRIVLTYKDNPNGSRGDIAGIANESGNVVGLMPHPERAMSTLLGSEDGRVLLESFVTTSLATLSR
ncbi:MAG: phosphoribosylformylglycinamidine synthase subunit PurQ [Acidimicrobiales bacterium]